MLLLASRTHNSQLTTGYCFSIQYSVLVPITSDQSPVTIESILYSLFSLETLERNRESGVGSLELGLWILDAER
jgi:hypothetical protein